MVFDCCWNRISNNSSTHMQSKQWNTAYTFTRDDNQGYFYISSDSFVLLGGGGGDILHNPRINCLKSWVRLWLFEGKSGANEQLIKMRGDYVLICKGDKSLITLWRHVVDLSVFCGILASFLDWISLSFTVVIPRPESSLSVNMQVGRKILGEKIEIVNCLLVFCTRKWRFKLFSESSCSTATEAALVWVKNGSTSGSESLDTARLFRLFLAFTANN